MNYTPLYGWYYRDSYDRTPSWSSCKFLYEFLTTNRGTGPFAIDVDEEYVEPGDIVQFANDENNFSHSAIVVKISNDNLFVAAHSDNAYDRPIDSYLFLKIRYIHILGANK
ncbi:MAG: amidase domain-containing protein [Clostridia bacterium]|nr:amidase domain-containing protein [Clostridia bacterium]